MNASGLSPKMNGIYRFLENVGPLRERAHMSGISWSLVDVDGVRDKRVLLGTFARELRFPGAFGANWDALADFLQDLSWLPGKGWVLELHGISDIAGAIPDVSNMLLEILGVTAEYWQRRGRVFIVLADVTVGPPVFPAP